MKRQWGQIYKAGEQRNRAPFDEAISFVYKNKPDKPNHNIRILEVGCGYGNNLAFLFREGFSVYGIEQSETAVNQTKKLLRNSEIVAGSFTDLPWEDKMFDLVIDRAALRYASHKDCFKAIGEIHRVLLPGGRFLFTPSCFNAEDSAESRFDDEDDALEYFPSAHWDVLSMEGVSVTDELEHYVLKHKHFRIVAEKRA